MRFRRWIESPWPYPQFSGFLPFIGEFAMSELFPNWSVLMSSRPATVRFLCRLGSDTIVGDVVNPGGWFGKCWLIQVSIANNLNPFYVIEADTEQDAIDVLADSERYSHLVDVPAEDCPKWDDERKEFEDSDYCQAGNDGHWIDLSNVAFCHGAKDLRYTLEWDALHDSLSSCVEDAIKECAERFC
jgi:hypothetical protein